MKKMIWNVLVLVGSIVLTSGVIMMLQIVVHYFFPMAPGTDITQLKDLETFLKVVPVSMMLAIELTYILGTVVGGYAVGRLAQSNHFIFAAILGCIMTAGNVLNIMTIPHPLWMIILTMITFIPCALIGCSIARKIS